MLKAHESHAPASGGVIEGTGPDARESQEWFLKLDPIAKDVLRQNWRSDELEWDRVTNRARRAFVDSMAQGALLVGGVQLVLVITLGMFLKQFTSPITVGAAISQIGLATLVGMALGTLWKVTNAGTMLCPILAFLASICLEWFLVANGSVHIMAVICGPALVGFSAGYVGLKREMLPSS